MRDREDYAPKLEDLENERIRLEGDSRPRNMIKLKEKNQHEKLGSVLQCEQFH